MKKIILILILLSLKNLKIMKILHIINSLKKEVQREICIVYVSFRKKNTTNKSISQLLL